MIKKSTTYGVVQAAFIDDSYDHPTIQKVVFKGSKAEAIAFIKKNGGKFINSPGKKVGDVWKNHYAEAVAAATNPGQAPAISMIKWGVKK